MRQASGRRRVQRHELQQLHGREERPPSPQHDHQREEGHRPRRYFGSQFAGCHPRPQSSGLVVPVGRSQWAPTPSPGTPVPWFPYTWYPVLYGNADLGKLHFPPSSLAALQDSFPNVTRALKRRCWKPCPQTGHISGSTLGALFHRTRPAKRGEARPSEPKRKPGDTQVCPPLPLRRRVATGVCPVHQACTSWHLQGLTFPKLQPALPGSKHK